MVHQPDPACIVFKAVRAYIAACWKRVRIPSLRHDKHYRALTCFCGRVVSTARASASRAVSTKLGSLKRSLMRKVSSHSGVVTMALLAACVVMRTEANGCGVGSYDHDGNKSTPCRDCEEGRYNAHVAATICHACLPGNVAWPSSRYSCSQAIDLQTMRSPVLGTTLAKSTAPPPGWRIEHNAR